MFADFFLTFIFLNFISKVKLRLVAPPQCVRYGPQQWPKTREAERRSAAFYWEGVYDSSRRETGISPESGRGAGGRAKP